MFCTECGEKNEAGAKVCKNCGKALSSGLNVKEIINNGKESFKALSKKDGKTYFNPRKYLSYAAYYQVWVWLIYIVLVGGPTLVALAYVFSSGYIEDILYVPFAALAGFIVAWIVTLLLKIKIQDMRWKVDIHSEIMKANKNSEK